MQSLVFGDRFVVSGEDGVPCDNDIMLLAIFDRIVLPEQRRYFDLINHRFLTAILGQFLQMTSKEVTHTNILDLPFIPKPLHNPPSLQPYLHLFRIRFLVLITIRPMNQHQIDITRIQACQNIIDGFSGFFCSLIGNPDFTNNVKLFSRYTAFFDCLSDVCLVVVKCGSIDVSVAELNGCFYGFDALLTLELVSAESQDRDLSACPEFYLWDFEVFLHLRQKDFYVNNFGVSNTCFQYVCIYFLKCSNKTILSQFSQLIRLYIYSSIPNLKYKYIEQSMLLNQGTLLPWLSHLKVTPNTPQHCQLNYQPELYRMLNLRTPEGQRNAEQLQKLFSSKSAKAQPFTRLKLVLLLHHLMMKFGEFRVWVRENEVEMGEDHWEGMRQRSGEDMVGHFAWLYYRMIRKYSFSEEIYQFSLKKQKQSDPAKAIQKTYLLMNLIRESSTLLPSIIFFGRYHRTQYLVITDILNILKTQLSLLYGSMYSCVYMLMHNTQTLDDTQSDQLLTILQEIPSVNEILFTYFYNRYYYEETGCYIDVLNPDLREYQVTVKELQLGKKRRRRERSMMMMEVEVGGLDRFEETYFGNGNGNGKGNRTTEIVI